MSGYVYIFSNPAFENLIKIGYTTGTIESRLKQLNTTGVPSPFVLEFCIRVPAPAHIEKKIHGRLAEYRNSANREFFNLTISEALKALIPVIDLSVTSTKADGLKVEVVAHDLNENEVLLLQHLVSAGNAVGAPEWRLKEYTRLEELDMEIYLANLYSKKFVARSTDRGTSYGPIWRCTPKGTKFLVDHHLVEKWMYDRF